MTPGDIATKHPDESLGDFYTRREQGLTYEEYQEAARLRQQESDAIVERARNARRTDSRGSTVTQETPGDVATRHPDESCRHPDESWGDFYTRREQGLTYEEYQEAARLPAPVQSAAAAPRGSTVTQGTPGDIATKHPHETYGEFYARRDRGLTYEECGVVGSTQGRGGAQADARRARDAAASAAASAAYVALIGFANGGRDARTITVRGTRGRGRTVTNKGGPDGDPRYGQLWCVFARPFPPPPTPLSLTLEI